MLPAIIHAPPRSIRPPRKPPRLLRICTAARTGDAAGEPVANSRRSCWSRSRSPAAKAEPDPGYPRVANTMTRVPRYGERMRSSGPASAGLSRLGESDRAPRAEWRDRKVAFAIAPRSCELAIPFAKSTCPVAALSRLPLGDRDSAARFAGRRFRASPITSCVGTDVPTAARDLDHRAVAWPEGAVISSLPAHALPQLVRWSGACGGPTRARFQGMRDCWAELLHSCDTSWPGIAFPYCWLA